ncbi:hypothetical protein B0H14DRAFT_3509882 [Mycena olivaceomarginata]|nr:hypothetical protein B0H14DRAFT_3509882 [Mycena olivaceomarginata]
MSCTKRIVPRYHFDYPALSTNDVLIFSTKVFWECFIPARPALLRSSSAVFAIRGTSPAAHRNTRPLLEQALPELRLALSRVDATQELPKDVTVALAGLDRVIVTLDQPPDEYTYLCFPDLGTSPYFAADTRPPTSQKQATDDELRNAPHLYRQLPNPIKKGKTPVKASKKRTHNSTDEESVRALSADETAATTSAKKSSGKVAPPAQKKVKLDPVAGTSKATPAKGPAPILRPLAPVNYSRDLDPSDEESNEQTIPGTKRRAGRASKKQDRLRQKEREHKATEAMVDALTTQLRESAISLIEGRDNFKHRSYNPRTALGPGANYTKQKEDEKFTPIRSVPILSADQMELENAIRPEWPCALCSLYRVICKPMGLGMACTNCNVKKLNSLCDHQMSGSRINRLYHDLAESAQAFVPSMEIDVPRLIKSGSTTADASSLVFHLREDFIEGFRHYLEALSEHHSRVGSDSFNEAFAPSLTADARELLQDLIAEYNYLLDPAPRVEGSTSPHESRKGSTAAPSPPSDENDHTGKGEGTSKSQGGAGGGD